MEQKHFFFYKLHLDSLYSVFEATSVFEPATKKTDCGTEAKAEGLISLDTFFFLW